MNKSFGGGLWETIGGSLEQYDKSFEDCITREIQEELLVDVDTIQEFKDYSITNEKGSTFLIKTFLVTLKSKPIPNQADFEEWGWFNKKEIEKLDFVSNCKERLLEYYSSE